MPSATKAPSAAVQSSGARWVASGASGGGGASIQAWRARRISSISASGGTASKNQRCMSPCGMSPGSGAQYTTRGGRGSASPRPLTALPETSGASAICAGSGVKGRCGFGRAMRALRADAWSLAARAPPCHPPSRAPSQAMRLATIQRAIATIITFSVSDTKPSGTLDEPPTQAHLSSRLSR